jgi:hypothetical protein
LLMIWDVRQRSVEHLEHFKCDVWPLRNLPSGGRTGDVEGWAGVGAARKGFEEVEDVEILELELSVLD